MKEFEGLSGQKPQQQQDPLEKDKLSDDLGEPIWVNRAGIRHCWPVMLPTLIVSLRLLIWPQFRCCCHFLLFELLLDGAKGKTLGDLYVLHLFILCHISLLASAVARRQRLVYYFSNFFCDDSFYIFSF
jgi:hypothetical protein